jgi:hypothetical protein
MDKYKETKDRYRQEKVDRLEIVVPKGEKDKIKAYAKSKSVKLSDYVFGLISKDIEQSQQ